MRVYEPNRGYIRTNPEGEQPTANQQDLNYYNSLRSGLQEYPADPTPSFLRLEELGYFQVHEAVPGFKGRKKSYEKIRAGKSPYETGAVGLDEFYGNRAVSVPSRTVTNEDFEATRETYENKLARVLTFLQSNPEVEFTGTKLGENVGLDLNKHPQFFIDLAKLPNILIKERATGKKHARIISYQPKGGK